MTRIESVTVKLASGAEQVCPWATSVRVDRKGNLRLSEGWQQRAFHPAGEWVSYTVTAAPRPYRLGRG